MRATLTHVPNRWSSAWAFPDLSDPLVAAGHPDDLVAVGADLAAPTLLQAYAAGLFPMPGGPRGTSLTWWCPVDRGVLPLDGLHVSRSLRRSLRRMQVRVDTAFAEVVAGCADPGRSGAWITADIAAAYVELHRLGFAHSVEAWREGSLVGGLYGVSLGGLFAGESMFSAATDASKVALVGLVEILRDQYAERRLLDVQWRTDHLATLGVVELPRAAYLRRLGDALTLPPPAAFRPPR